MTAAGKPGRPRAAGAGPAAAASAARRRRNKPHDALLRATASVPRHGAALLRSRLPPALLAGMNLARLTPAPADFIDEALGELRADVMHTVPICRRRGYINIEGMSYIDLMMADRMLGYGVGIWTACRRRHPRAKQRPPVIGLVVYNGRRRWTAPRQFADLIPLDPAVAAAAGDLIPRMQYLVLDLSQVTADEMRDWPLTPLMRAVLLVLKIAPRSRSVVAELRESWLEDLQAVVSEPGGPADFARILVYLGMVSKVPRTEIRALAAAVGQEAEEAFVTAVQEIRAEGRAEGRTEGSAKTLQQVLTGRFGKLPADVVKKLRGGSARQLLSWAERAGTVETLDELFR